MNKINNEIIVYEKDLLQRKYVQHFQGQVTKIVPLTHLNKYLHNDTSETEVRIKTSVSNGSENVKKKKKDTATFEKGITAVYASAFYV